MSAALAEGAVTPYPPAPYPPVVAGDRLTFPRDYGAHPDYRTEWWYVTGWVAGADGKKVGFQVTFFRSKLAAAAVNPSGFAPTQILFAHAALADATVGRLLHDERVARAGFGLASAKEGNTDVWIDDWRLVREGESYRATLPGRTFSFDLLLKPTQPVLEQGLQGYSRKGPRDEHASHYYSEPHLAVSGSITRHDTGGNGKVHVIAWGSAWLDHEWSTAYLAEGAVGWDWTGINLEDGGALMVFRIRDAEGQTLWAGGSHRRADGRTVKLVPADILFTPTRQWRSPRTNGHYPVAMQIDAGSLSIELEPLMDDQELDSRASTGAVYWEGAVTARQDGRTVGRGYLELTGYLRPLRM